jgi:hypothetical protein
MPYFSGQGKLFAAGRDSTTGLPNTSFKFLGNVPELSVNLSTDVSEHKESVSGSRVIDFRLTRMVKCEVNFSLEEFNPQNLAIGMYGTKAEESVTTAVTNEQLPILAVGEYARVKRTNIASVSVVDSLAGAVVLNTGYTLNAVHGMIKCLVPGANQPWKINYTPAASTNVTMFSAPSQERWLRFEGLNTADTNKAVLVEVYRVILDPMSQLAMIGDDINKFPLKGNALYDATHEGDAQLGTFGRVNFTSAAVTP